MVSWVSAPRTTPVGAASGREGVGLVTAALSPYQISSSPPYANAAQNFGHYGFTCLCALASRALQGGTNSTSSAASGKSPTPAQRRTPYPFPHSVQNGGEIHFVPLPPQAVTLLEQIHKITGKFDLVFAGDAKPWKPMSENTANAALSTMRYDTNVDMCNHGFRTMACSAPTKSGLWSVAIERQMSHKERNNNVRAVYIHKIELIEERRLIMNWRSRYLETNLQKHVTPHEFVNQTRANVTRPKAKRGATE